MIRHFRPRSMISSSGGTKHGHPRRYLPSLWLRSLPFSLRTCMPLAEPAANQAPKPCSGFISGCERPRGTVIYPVPIPRSPRSGAS
jgi:hypothetical protein